MIKINDTKNLIGITIHGDYQDLQTLHHALSDYLRFYFDHQEGSAANFCYECILGLCYDIRHAYQGDRNIEAVENNHENIEQLASCIYQLDNKAIEKERRKYKNGNLYFNVEILYPWAIYYLYALQAITDDIYQHEWFTDDEFGYTEYQAESDLALIQYFVQLLWTKIKEHLPEDVMQILWDYTRTFNHIEYYFEISDMYMEWLCTYWVNAFRNKYGRHEVFPLICLELSSILDELDADLEATIADAYEQEKSASVIIGDTLADHNSIAHKPATETDEIRSSFLNFELAIAQTTLEGLKRYDEYFDKYSDDSLGKKCCYLCQYELAEMLSSYVSDHGYFTEESFDAWLDEHVGSVDWNMLEW